MQTRLLFRRKEFVVLMCCFVMLLSFVNSPGANAANKSAKTSDQRRMNDLKKELQRIDTIGQELKRDHPGDSRPPIEIVKSDIEFEKGFATMLSEQKLKAEAALLLFKTGVFLDKRPRGDRMATVKATNNKLKPYFRVDEHGNIYFLPIFTGIPYQFPTFAMTPAQAIDFIEKLAVKNNKQLDTRKSQLSLLEQEQRLRDELSSLERKAKTIADVWIYDPHLENTSRKNTYKAVVGTILRFKIMVRYNDDTDETLTHDPAKGIYLVPSVLTVTSANKYNVHVALSNNMSYTFTVEGYCAGQDFISFVKTDYPAREGRDEIITIELQRQGTGKGRVTARFREILGKGTRAGDYAVIDPFPTWEDEEVGKKPIRVKIYDNKDNSYSKVITLQLEPNSGADLKHPKSTQITIKDDDMGGRLRIVAPRYNVDETEKTVRIGIERVGERALSRVTVRIQTRNGSAKEEDYKAFSDTLTWEPTDKGIKHVEIPIMEDKVEEGSETFQVTLSDPTGGALLGTPNTTEITIRDVKDRQDGIQKARFSRSEYRVGEGGAGIRITVHREGGTQGEFKVDYLTQDAYAQAGKDYETSHGTLTWKDGDDRPQDFMVKMIDDQEPEPRLETIHLQLKNPRNPEVSVGFDATGTEAVIYIEDNDSETDEKPLETDTPTTSSTGLSATLDCGDSFELAPGDFAGRGCGIVIQGWRSNTEDRVEVRVDFDRNKGLEIFPGDWSMSPSNMYTAGTTDLHDRYVLSQSFRASSNARPGVYPVRFTVSQPGLGTVRLRLEVMILEPGQTPSTGPGIRPPATVKTGSGGQYCVWRFKSFGDPPNCFHFAAAKCDHYRYTNPRNGYELIGQDMKWEEADAMIARMSRYQKDEYGCLPGPKQKKVVSIVVIPSGHQVRVFETVTFTARAIFDDHTQEDITGSATWPSGKSYTPSQSGPFTRNAEYKGITGSVTVQVLPPKVLFITVYPGNITIHIGETVTFSAQATFENHTVKDVTGEAAWPQRPNVFTGTEEGTYNMQAEYRGASDYSTITVESPSTPLSTSEEKCASNEDCPHGKVCKDGRCVPSSAPEEGYGGLFISGPARMVLGSGAVFQAADGGGKPYAGVEWASSVEDVVTIGGGGSAVANKVGSATIIAHKDDMTAFFDVAIVECILEADCPAGYVCSNNRCVSPMDSSYGTFGDIRASADADRAMGLAMPPAGDGSPGFTQRDLVKGIDKTHDYVKAECNASKPCPTGYECVDGKCVKKSECKEDKDCQEGHECKDGKCVKKQAPDDQQPPPSPPPQQPTPPSGLSDVTVNVTPTKLTVWDYSREDLDRVDIYLNNKIIETNLTIRNVKRIITISLQEGSNVLIVKALNIGDPDLQKEWNLLPYNSAAIEIEGVVVGKKSQQWTLKEGETGTMQITYQPEP